MTTFWTLTGSKIVVGYWIMTMSNCKECGKAVSTEAKTCPKCGLPKPASKLKIKKKAPEKLSMTKKPFDMGKFFTRVFPGPTVLVAVGVVFSFGFLL